MRFSSLQFAAFGPFTGLELDLSGGAPGGFHLVYGANEAGKSSALRGVHGLLFGFPERTPDDHVHPSRDLRIRARLASDTGTLLDVQRLKKRKDSLRDAADVALEESALEAFLGGVDAQVFERLFGLDHERLRHAGEALLEDKGDVGESLFDAGSGGRGIRQVLEQLGEEADDLFKPRSSKARLNVLIERYKESKTALRDAQVFPEKWQQQAQKLAAEKTRLLGLIERRRRLREESFAQKGLQSALGPIAKRNDLRDKLVQLGALPVLAEDARERRERAQRALEQATHESARLEREALKKRARLAELVVPDNLLNASAEAIERLRDRVGDFRKAEKDLPRRREEVRVSEAHVQRLAATLYPGQPLEQLEKLRPSAAEIARVRKLSQEQVALRERVASAQKALFSLELKRSQAEATLRELPVVPELGVKRRALAALRTKGDVERRVREAEAARKQLDTLARARLSALGIWRGPLEAAPGLALPADETVALFEGRFAELEKQRAELERDHALLVEHLQHNAQKISALERSGSVPSEAALEQARQRRDDGLRRVLGAWAKGEPASLIEPDFAAEQPLAQAFEQALKAADEHADRLRREAERVSTLAQLSAERDRLLREQVTLEASRAAVEERGRALETAWRAAWGPAEIEPRSPQEMRAWLVRQRSLVELVLRLSDAERELELARAEHAALLADVARTLGVSGSPSLAELLATAEEAIEVGTRAEQTRTELGKGLADTEREKAELEQELAAKRTALDAWQAEWSAATGRFGLALSPDDVGAFLDTLTALFASLDQLADGQRRARRMEQDAADFAAHVREWLETYAPDLLSRAPDMAAEELVSRFQAAEHHRAEQRRLEAELAEIFRALSEHEARAGQARSELEGLLQAAQAADLPALAAIEEKVAEARELSRQLEAVEGSLLNDEAMPLDALLEAARGVDRAALQVRLESLQEEVDRLDEEIQDLSAEVGELERGLERYEENEAADHAQGLSVQAAEIREQVARYARLKLSSVVLAREVERYREQNQGPVLKRANALFPRLTLGHFRGLRVGVEERKIALVREDGREVPVEGLSEGTRYQLYLALRIASLERYLERNPPLPLVLDDILIHFDDERAAAALGVLGELAERIQILFFTHHARDLGLARSAIPATRLFQHDLSGPPPK